MNNVVLTGRLTRDPELKYLPGSGQAVAKFTLAVDKGLSKEKKREMEIKNQPTADFIIIVAWGKLGENVANFTAKGRLVAVQGRIQTGHYEKASEKVYTTEVVANNIEFLEWKDKKDETPMDGFYSVDDTGLPF